MGFWIFFIDFSFFLIDLSFKKIYIFAIIIMLMYAELYTRVQKQQFFTPLLYCKKDKIVYPRLIYTFYTSFVTA